MTTLVQRRAFTFSDDVDRVSHREPLLAAPLPGPEFNSMTSLEALRGKVLAPFDEDNPRHILVLETLWHCAFPGGDYPQRFQRRGEMWKELGFQGVDPTTDLRGGGHLALEHLLKFVIANRGGVEGLGFPLAIASISCTAMLARHFCLHPTLVLTFPGASAQPECSTAALHHLLALHHGGTDALQALHAALLLHLAREWEALERPARTIMDFPIALGRAYRHLCDATAPGWDHAMRAGPPLAWLQGVLARLERQGADGWLHGGADTCCVHPGAALAVLLVLLRSLGAKRPSGQVGLHRWVSD